MMKYKQSLLVALLASLPTAHAANIALSNISFSGQDLALYDNSGTPLMSGFAAIYDFSGGTPSDVFALQANGNTGLISSIAITGANSPAGGALSTGFSPNNNDGSLTGVNLFVVIGNGADAASSTQFALIDSGSALTGTDVPVPESLSIALNTSLEAGVSIGTVGPQQVIDWGAITGGGPPGADYNTASLTLALIPEPSSTLLFGLAGLTLLIRRRR